MASPVTTLACDRWRRICSTVAPSCAGVLATIRSASRSNAAQALWAANGAARRPPAITSMNVRRSITEPPRGQLEVGEYYASRKAWPLRRPSGVSQQTSINGCLYGAQCALTAVGPGQRPSASAVATNVAGVHLRLLGD